MLISYLVNDSYAYINMHAEQAYIGYYNEEIIDENYLHTVSQGIFSNELTESAVKELLAFSDDLKENKNIKTLILDFIYLKKIQQNLQNQLNEFKDKVINLGITLIIVNINVSISDYFSDENSSINVLEGRKCILGYKKENIKELDIELKNNSKKVFEEIQNIYDSNLKLMINECCTKEPSLLESSPVKTNKYINIKSCIERKKFFPYYVYMLALKMIDNGMVSRNPKENKKISLFCHTLNGAYISGLLTKLLCLDLIFFDHLGPKNKIYNTFLENRVDKQKEYIVVTDMICLKSELRAVKTLLDYERADYKGAVAIVYCNTVYDIEDNYNICSLLEINKTNNMEYQYFIETDLMKGK